VPSRGYYANGLKTRRLGTLNCSDVPVVEIEMGNMKNAGDAARMSSRTGDRCTRTADSHPATWRRASLGRRRRVVDARVRNDMPDRDPAS
jgi:hypothetical protein